MTNLWVYFYIAIKILHPYGCVLSHGQISVEIDFSVNKELLVENLSKVSLTSQPQVYDYFQSFGIKIHNYTIPTNFIKRCKGAHARYQAALEDNKVAQAKSEKDRNRKLVSEEFSEVKRKLQATENVTLSLNKDIAKLSLKVEEKRDCDLLKKANFLRKAVTDNEAILKT